MDVLEQKASPAESYWQTLLSMPLHLSLVLIAEER